MASIYKVLSMFREFQAPHAIGLLPVAAPTIVPARSGPFVSGQSELSGDGRSWQ
jgi:hypothetical protein